MIGLAAGVAHALSVESVGELSCGIRRPIVAESWLTAVVGLAGTGRNRPSPFKLGHCWNRRLRIALFSGPATRGASKRPYIYGPRLSEPSPEPVEIKLFRTEGRALLQGAAFCHPHMLSRPLSKIAAIVTLGAFPNIVRALMPHRQSVLSGL
jgi:hypothetical protein